MAEFTGERVIPGQVEIDLWNEHAARYAFAARFASGRRVLDLGCGSGYGTASLASTAASATGLDIAADAVAYGIEHYSAPNLRYLRAACTDLPFADAAFDFVVAFEVIEHLADWEKLLHEARRVLAPGGQFLVSTPNKEYYAASRGHSGPNPYHVHEFDFAEFRAELARVFPHVAMFLQNHVDGFAFQPALPAAPAPALAVEDAGADPASCSFFIALCSPDTRPESGAFVYVPKTANVLRERELHIEMLEHELAVKNEWLAKTEAEKQKLVDMFREQTAELEERNRWAAETGEQLKAARQRIADLQDELAAQQAAAMATAAAYNAKIAELEQESCRQAEWALETEKRLGEKCNELAECVRLLDTAEATVEERTKWALGLQSELEQTKAQLGMVRASRWMRLGRVFGLGPEVRNG